MNRIDEFTKMLAEVDAYLRAPALLGAEIWLGVIFKKESVSPLLRRVL